MAKPRSPVLGYNHNVRHLGWLFHVQTEDSGVQSPHVYTHLFHSGVILTSKKLDYAADADAAVVKSLMQAQHKAVLKELKAGALDEKIRKFLGDAPPQDDAAPAEASWQVREPGRMDTEADLAPPTGAGAELTLAEDVATAAPVVEAVPVAVAAPVADAVPVAVPASASGELSLPILEQDWPGLEAVAAERGAPLVPPEPPDVAPLPPTPAAVGRATVPPAGSTGRVPGSLGEALVRARREEEAARPVRQTANFGAQSRAVLPKGPVTVTEARSTAPKGGPAPAAGPPGAPAGKPAVRSAASGTSPAGGGPAGAPPRPAPKGVVVPSLGSPVARTVRPDGRPIESSPAPQMDPPAPRATVVVPRGAAASPPGAPRPAVEAVRPSRPTAPPPLPPDAGGPPAPRSPVVVSPPPVVVGKPAAPPVARPSVRLPTAAPKASGAGALSEKSLDEVILAYLSDDGKDD